MSSDLNHLGQPIGFAVPDWHAAAVPSREPMVGRVCRVERLDAFRHAESVFAANALDADGRMWTYLPYGPFETFTSYRDWLEGASRTDDPLFFAIIAEDERALGVASYLRIDRAHGVIEVGHIALSPALQRTRIATEAMYLMMERAFSAGYRRYEWKCNALNAPSRAAAQRLGFSFEGIFRQHQIVKGRNRDTAWYAVTDQEWPKLQEAFRRWLEPDNFDAHGRQRLALSALTGPLLARRG